MSTKHTDPGRLHFRAPPQLRAQLEAFARSRGENLSQACVYLLKLAMEERLGKTLVPPDIHALDAGNALESVSTPMLKVAETRATYLVEKPVASAKRRSRALASEPPPR